MAAPYSSQSISGFNTSPPADDGSQVVGNRITWAGVKSKLADPIKTRTDNMDSAITSAFGKTLGSNGVGSTAIDYQVQGADQGKLIKATASPLVITTPDATSVNAPFAFAVNNSSSGAITIDGSGTQTVDGALTISIPSGAGVNIETDGTNWFTHGQNYVGTISPPQGRVTLTSGVPVLSADVSAATSVYYTPYIGNLIPIYNGTIYQMRSFAELTLTLQSNSNYAASTIYELFVFDSSGAVTFGMGPAWSTLTAGSGARGTGAGTTELQRFLGFNTNKNSMTCRNGASTFTVAANQGTYVGTILMDASNGQVSCHVSAGQSRKWGIWNAHNRKPITLKVQDTTASWNNSASFPTFTAANASTANSFTSLVGLPEEEINASYTVYSATVAAGRCGFVAVGFNSTTAAPASGIFGNGVTGIAGDFGGTLTGSYTNPASTIGQNVFTALESSTTSATFQGVVSAQNSMLMTGKYLG